jgi:catechol 2,3-dioxygenase-like lactoylglutathione lyase family enzyme
MTYKFNHIGHVVTNLEEGMKIYEKLGLVPRERMEFPEFGAKMVFYPFAGIEIELIQPGGLKGDPAARCLKERGEGIFHISILVDDYEAEVKKLRERGFTVEEYTHEGPEDTVRLAFLAIEETKGLWIEFMQAPKDHS